MKITKYLMKNKSGKIEHANERQKSTQMLLLLVDLLHLLPLPKPFLKTEAKTGTALKTSATTSASVQFHFPLHNFKSRYLVSLVPSKFRPQLSFFSAAIELFFGRN